MRIDRKANQHGWPFFFLVWSIDGVQQFGLEVHIGYGPAKYIQNVAGKPWVYHLHEEQIHYLREKMLPVLNAAPIVLRVEGHTDFGWCMPIVACLTGMTARSSCWMTSSCPWWMKMI